MADLKEIQIGSTVYNLKDETARNSISALQAAVGSPLVANTAASMSDTTKIYVYTGSETGYETGHWYYHNGSAWTDGGLYQSRGIAANSVTGSKLASPIRSSLISFFQNVAMTTPNGQSLYQAVYNALYDVAVESIEAVFTQSDNLVFTCDSLDDLKQYLTVTAHFEDDTEIEVSDYTLSGTLTAGTSTITVTYQDKTATFTVHVTEGTDVTPALSSFVPVNNTNVSVDTSANSIRVYSRANQTYGGANYTSFAWESGYTYHVSVEVIYVAGVAAVGFRDLTTSSLKGGSTGSKTESGKYEFDSVLSEKDSVSNPCGVALFTTMGTSTKGDVTYKNLRIVKYMAEGGE